MSRNSSSSSNSVFFPPPALDLAEIDLSEFSEAESRSSSHSRSSSCCFATSPVLNLEQLSFERPSLSGSEADDFFPLSPAPLPRAPTVDDWGTRKPVDQILNMSCKPLVSPRHVILSENIPDPQNLIYHQPPAHQNLFISTEATSPIIDDIDRDTISTLSPDHFPQQQPQQPERKRRRRTPKRSRKELTEEEKKDKEIERKEKNKTAAKLCRDKKKTQIQQLHQKLIYLQQENKRLTALCNSNQPDEKSFLIEQLSSLLRCQQNNSEQQIHSLIHAYKEKYVLHDHNSKKNNSILEHIEKIEQELQPTPIAKLAFLQHPFVKAENEPEHTNFATLLNLSPHQQEKLDSLVCTIENRKLKDQIKFFLDKLQQLHHQVKNSEDLNYHGPVSNLFDFLSSEQSAKLILYVEEQVKQEKKTLLDSL